MTGTATTDVRDRVTAVLARHFEDGAFLVSSVTGGTAAIVTAGQNRIRLAYYAATLREAGFTVAHHGARCRLYVREHGPEHDAAMAREIARICLNGYNEHLREHGSAGGDKPGEESGPARFTVEREGTEYDVIVMPRERA